MRHIHSFKYLTFFIIILTFLSGEMYSQKDRTVGNPDRNDMGDRKERPGNNDKTDKRIEHKGIVIERPDQRAPDPIPPKRNDPPTNPPAYTPPLSNPTCYNPPAYNPPAYNPPPYYPPCDPPPDPEPTDVIIEPLDLPLTIYRPKEPEEPQDLLKIGIAKLDYLDYKGALEDFNYAIEEDTSNYKLYYYRGLALIGLKYYLESIKDFNIYLKYFFYDMDGYFQRGLAKFYLCEKIKALEDFQSAADMGHKQAAFIIKKFY